MKSDQQYNLTLTLRQIFKFWQLGLTPELFMCPDIRKTTVTIFHVFFISFCEELQRKDPLYILQRTD